MTTPILKPAEVKPWLLGSLSPSKPGKHYVMPPLDFAASTRVCNASAPPAAPGEITKILTGNTRPGSDRRLHPSKGGC